MPVDIIEAMAIEIAVGIAIAMAMVKALAIQLTNHLIQSGDLDIIQALGARFQSPLSAVQVLYSCFTIEHVKGIGLFTGAIQLERDCTILYSLELQLTAETQLEISIMLLIKLSRCHMIA
jgi:hypothetical protein